MIFTSKVPLNAAPVTIADYLAGRFTYLDRDEWVEKIKSGRILLNDVRCTAESITRKGDMVSYIADNFDEPPADLNYRIIYEDQWFLGIDKPGNLLVHRAGKSFKNNLMFQLRHVHIPSYPDSHSAHRLDRETSGAVIVAKSAEARAAIQPQFSSGTIVKQYVAIVHGIPDKHEFTIDKPIGKEELSEVTYKFKVDSSGKPAITRIEQVTPVGSSYSLLRIKPLTGRTHQIRIHLVSAGYPIVGDKLYGLSEREYLRWRDKPAEIPQTLLIDRHALHCAFIKFLHPFTNKECRIEAPMPSDIKALIEKLEKL